MQILLLALILIAASTLYITRWLSTEVTSVLAIAGLALSGVLRPEQALSGFSSTATLTVGAMFVLSAGLLRTGALEAVTIYLARFSQGSPRRVLLLLGITIPIASAFMNNTPVVVMMVPVILSLSNQFKIRPSKLLIPVSYFAVLGGTMTLLGTSTNILIDDLYRSSGGPGFDLFAFAPLGIIYTLVGVTVIVLFSQRFLPDRAPMVSMASQEQSAIYVTELVVQPGSPLIGRRAEDIFHQVTMTKPNTLRLPHRHRRLQPPRHQITAPAEEQPSNVLELLEVGRHGRTYRADESHALSLQSGDALLMAGTASRISRLMQENDLVLAPVLADTERTPVSRIQQLVVEAVVLPDSAYAGRRLGALGLHRIFGVSIMGLQRRGQRWRSNLREMVVQGGDVLLLRGDEANLAELKESPDVLLIEGVDNSIIRTDKNRTALLIMAGVVLLATFSPLPIVVLALLGAGLMVITRCLRTDEAVRALDSSTLMLLVATIPMGLAMDITGMAQIAVDHLLKVLGMTTPLVFLSLFYLFTSLLTQIISNNAVAVLLTPIALSLAVSLGISPTPLLMAIAFGASASFMTPMGYQTNAIVMGPGGYTFTDYLRIGIPLQIIMWLVATVLIPILWPL